MNQRRILSSTGLILAAVLSVGIIILVNTSVTGYRLDLTQNRLFTLSRGTVNILHSLKEPITLDFYYSRQLLVNFPQLKNYAVRVRDLLEEYADRSNGKIKLNVIEPEPFSDAEDHAVSHGLHGISVNAAGDRAYLGLVGTNSTDDEDTVPFFQPDKEASLEYDITKLVYNLAHPEKNTVGVMSFLPLFGTVTQQGPTQPWAIIPAMKEFFNIKKLGTDTDHISDDVNVLMLVHPKKLSDQTMYAIDQFLLRGGKAMIFVDPLAENDEQRTNPDNPYALPDVDSNLKTLFDDWGIKLVKEKIAGDKDDAMQVQTRGPRGPQEATYLPWLKLGEDNFNQDDFATSQLQTINVATAGILEQEKDSPVTFTPLIETSKDSMEMNRDLIMFQRDPNVIMDNFKSGNKKLVLAARLSGKVKTAFPDGPPPAKTKDKAGNPVESAPQDKSKQVKEGELNAIVVADSDMLADMFWTRQQNFFGVNVPQTIADNGNFVINSLQNLMGNTDLISLRSRGGYERPFKVVEKIRRNAEEQFRQREEQLQQRLKETESKIEALQKQGTGNDMILSPEQEKEIEQFRQEQLKTRKELRDVQHNLEKDIDRLGGILKFINIGLVPLLIALLAVGAGVYRHRRHV